MPYNGPSDVIIANKCARKGIILFKDVFPVFLNDIPQDMKYLEKSGIPIKVSLHSAEMSPRWRVKFALVALVECI